MKRLRWQPGLLQTAEQMRPVALMEVWPEIDEASRREVGREFEQARPRGLCPDRVACLGVACGETGEDADQWRGVPDKLRLLER